jgi:RNA polymerase sigma factor (sigma-70 family)
LTANVVVDPKAELIEQVAPVVRAILIRKSGMSLAADDDRRDNVDAIDLYQDVLSRLWERLSVALGSAPALRDFKGYAASTTYNAWSDYLREKYPQRASLKNRLRYFLGHQTKYAVWENDEGELVGGFKRWQFGAGAPNAERLAALRDQRERLPTGSVPRTTMQRFAAADWARLLDRLFDRIGAPVALDDLVSTVAVLIGLKEDRQESLDEPLGEDDPEREIADTDGSRPDDEAEIQSMLARLWAAIRTLKPDYRCAYLLNIPGPGKSRGDIEVFAMRGVASITEIGAAVALSDEQYALLWDALEMEPADRRELEQLRGADECFCLLWKYLPLGDALIGRLLGLAQQQVINRRMLALRELARALADDGSRRGDR